MKKLLIISLCLLGFSLSKFDNQTLIDEAEKKYPGRYSGQTFIKIDASKETFPQDGSVESTSCKSRIYAQKRTRYTLNPPYLFMEHDKGLFSAFEFNKCYHTPLHIHTCNRWGEFPNNYKMEYDANTKKVRVLKYKSGTSKTELGDVGCTGTYSASNWLTIDEFNSKYAKIGFFKIEGSFKIATEPIDYAAYTSYNADSSCSQKIYGERLYYKYDIYWSFNAAEDGWYNVQYKVVQNPNESLKVARFDQYWGEYGIDKVQTTWCDDGDLVCGACYGPSQYMYEYVECGTNVIS